MNLIRLNNIKKTFGGTLLFEHVSFEVNDDDKIALIGRNGVGKSTLFKIILSEVSPDSGEIFISGQVSVGYLSQDVLSKTDMTLYGEMLEVFARLVALKQELDSVMLGMQTIHDEKTVNRYSQLEEKFLHLGGYTYETDIDIMLTKFGFAKDDYARMVSSFSGGEKTRIAFAKLLLMHPDILLLDEPTNHMDIQIIEWLEEYLCSYKGAVIVITHDKYFINRVARKIYELDHETLEKYTGDFEAYENEKEKRYELLLKRYDKQQKEIAHLQSFVDRFRYKATKAKSAQDRIKKLNRIDKIDKPTRINRHINVGFTSKRPTDAEILKVEDLVIGYDRPLTGKLNLTICGKDKIGIIGPNGIGKTTFVKTLIGQLKPLSGKAEFVRQLKIGYFDQMADKTNYQGTLLGVLHSIHPGKTLHEIRSLLARFLFYGEDVMKDVNVLSGGEIVRFRLLLLMLENPEILILDEPTNHLDIETRNIVEDVFEEYDGPIIFISHDRYFINKVASRIIVGSVSGWEVFEGNYDVYKTKIEIMPVKSVTREKRQRKPDSGKELGKLAQTFEELTQRISTLKSELFDPKVYSDPDLYALKSDQITSLEAQSETLLARIEEIASETRD